MYHRYIFIFIYLCMYTYIYREREIDRCVYTSMYRCVHVYVNERASKSEGCGRACDDMYYWYLYIYTYIYIYR